MMHIHYQAFTTWLHLHPEWGGIAAFIVAFAESVAILGTIIPGSVTMTAIGILVGSGVIPAVSTIVFAIIGAVVGDSLSYITGYYFKDRMTKIWPFSRYPKWLEGGKRFFGKHGGKSVFFGRFIGPVRAMIPIIAGMLHMRPIKFFPIDILAAAIWAPAYLFPGCVVGYAAMSLPADVAVYLILCLLGILILSWLTFWVVQKTSEIVTKTIDRILNRVWRRLLKSHYGRWICTALRDANHPDDHGQLLLCLCFFLALVLFAWTFINSFYYGILHHADISIYHFFRGFRAIPLDKAAILINSLGRTLTLLPIILILFVILLFTNRRWAAIHWLCTCFFTISLFNIIQLIHFSPRPGGIQVIVFGSSFPSSQVALSCSFYGLLAWFICLEKPKWKKIIYRVAGSVILLMMLTEMYLGYYWFSDVLGAFLLSTVCATGVAISYQRRIAPPPRAWSLLIVSIIGIMLTLSLDAKLNFEQQLFACTPVWKKENVPSQLWWQQRTNIIPVYRRTRFGRPAELFNLEWAGDITDIREALMATGWEPYNKSFAKKILAQLKEEKKMSHVDILPLLYADQPPILIMTKKIDQPPYHLIIRLWPSHITLQPENWTLWIGTINHPHPYQKQKFLKRIYQLTSVETTLKAVQTALIKQHWKIVAPSEEEIPAKLLPIPAAPHYIILVKPGE